MFIDTVLPVLDDPCHTLETRQKSTEENIAAFVLPLSLLTRDELDAFVQGAVLGPLVDLEENSQLLAQFVSLISASAAPKSSNISFGAQNFSGPACSCSNAAACTSSFMPAFNDLPIEPYDPNKNSPALCNPLWTCDVLDSAQSFPMELMNMTNSAFLQSLGIPRSCEAFFQPNQTMNVRGKDGNVGSILARPGGMFIYYPPFCTDPKKGCQPQSLLDYGYQEYFQQCQPSIFSYTVQTDLFSNAWLFFLITVSALHSELELLKLLTGPLVDFFGNLAAQWLAVTFIASGGSALEDDDEMSEEKKAGGGSLNESSVPLIRF